MFWVVLFISFAVCFRLGFRIGRNLFKPGGFLK